MNRISIALGFSLVAYGSSALAQEAPPQAEPMTAPIQITAAPPPPGAVTAPPQVPAGEISVVSAGDPVDIGLVPLYGPVPPDQFMRYDCHTPCTLRPPLGDYHLVARSATGRLSQPIRVSPGSQMFRVTPPGRRSLGIGLLAGGGGVFILGLSVMLVGLETSALGSGFGAPNVTGYYVVGGLMGLAGLALAIPGILVLRSSSGRVESGSGPTVATRPPRGPSIVAFGAAPVAGGVQAGLTVAF